MNKGLSICCFADVKIEGDKEGTQYYVCTKCNQPCDYINSDNIEVLEDIHNK